MDAGLCPGGPLLLLLLLLAVLSGAASECVPRSATDTLHLQQLRKRLLCSYDRVAGPAGSSDQQTLVRLQFLRTRMDLDEEDNSMTLFGYIMLTWKDPSLSWSAAEYPNVTRVYVEADEIWTPEIAMLDAPHRALRASQALILNGTVAWTLLTPVTAPCVNDPVSWPYDKMVCNLTICNLSSSTAKLQNSSIGFNVIKWRNKGWEMTGMRMKPFQASGFRNGVFVLISAQRRADLHEATTVPPCLALCAMLLAALWLPADTPHRPLLLCAVILLQILMNVVVPLRIRVVGVHPPGVLLMLRDVLLVSGAALLQWLLARWLLLDQVKDHPWPLSPLAHLADYSSSPGGARIASLLLLAPTSAGDIADGETLLVPKAVRMAAITDRITFLLIAAVLGVMSARLLP